uniref:Uncharacterized protein n=1 Tax=Lactuca sativa TaxID=4236 RepID=A0A9R1VLK8_LACSA|nr:hypothetical protein LSAT_V11C500256040 [Lactuca sativa]
MAIANSLEAVNHAPILVPSEYTSWADRIKYYLEGHDSDIYTFISTGKHTLEFLKDIRVPEADVSPETSKVISGSVSSTAQLRDRKIKKFEAKAMQELLSGIPHDIYEKLPDEDKSSPFNF